MHGGAHLVPYVLAVTGVLRFAAAASAQEVRLERLETVLGREQPLYRVQDVALVNGMIVVLTAPDPAVHVFRFGSDTQAIRYAAFGEEGSGPGELRNPMAVAVGGSLIHVLDLIGGAPRIVSYSEAGEPRRTSTLNGVSIAVRVAEVGGTLIVEATEFASRQRKLIRVGEQDNSIILEYIDAEKVRLVSDQGPLGSLRLYAPFAPRPRWTVTAGGELAFWPGRGSRVSLYRLSGESGGSLSLPTDPISVAETDHDAWIRRNLPRDEEFFGVRDAYRGLREAAARSLAFPTEFPLVLGLEPDPGGGVWVLRAERASGQVWSLIGPSETLSTVIAPPGREIVAFGLDVIAAKATDEYGVEIVEIYTRPDIVR